MSKGKIVADGITSSGVLLKRFLPGFDDHNHTRQAPGLPNHLAWNLGHLAHTMHRVGERLDGVPPDPAAFIAGSDRGDRERFGTESVAFRSVPTDDPSRYPTLARCVAIFDGACERLAGAFRASDDAALDRAAPWGATQIPIWQMGLRMIFHNGTHCGQVIDLRRALGMGNVLG